MNSLLSTAYFAPIGYFALLQHSENVLLEKFEHYQKQTYRNRCTIYGANGPLSLTVPVTKGNVIKIYTKDIRIDYSSNWVKIHYKAIESAYNSSPFYQFYIDEIGDVWHKTHNFLYDLNFDLLALINDLTKTQVKLSGTKEYLPSAPEGFIDFRNITKIKTKDISDVYHYPHYMQVFESKFGFIENLSILDLLFNLGPDTGLYLSQVTGTENK
jgi:hypothetical protein